MPPRVVLSVFSTFSVGGAQVRFTSIANHFGPRYRHAIIAMSGQTECRERLDPTLDVSFPTLSFRKGDTLRNVRTFRRFLQLLQPDVLVTSNFGTIEWAIANLFPVVRHVHMEDGFGPEERERQIARRVWLRRLLLRRATVMLPSRNLLRIARTIWRLPDTSLRYIPNGIDLERFGAATPTTPWPAGEGPVMGTVAALRAEKNLPRLLRAFAKVATELPGRLVIVGDGPERAGLEALAASLGLAARVHLIGHVAAPQGLYRGFDLYALSSDTEQMPMTILEAMAASLPIAATDVGDVADMVAPENRPFVAPLTDAALAESLRALMTNAALRHDLGKANRAKVVRDYDQQAMFTAYAALFDGVPAPDS